MDSKLYYSSSPLIVIVLCFILAGFYSSELVSLVTLILLDSLMSTSQIKFRI